MAQMHFKSATNENSSNSEDPWKSIWPLSYQQTLKLDNGRIITVTRSIPGPTDTGPFNMSPLSKPLYLKATMALESGNEISPIQDSNRIVTVAECMLSSLPINTPDSSNPPIMEFALTTKDTFRGQGICRKLFMGLTAVARTKGIQCLQHIPIPLPPANVLEKWQKLRWLTLENLPGNKVKLQVNLNFRW